MVKYFAHALKYTSHYMYKIAWNKSTPVQQIDNSSRDSYRRPGFNCESLINANCDFSLRSQLLECNYYYVMIDSVHVAHVLTLLCSCDQR